jgi:hypothetical protein
MRMITVQPEKLDHLMKGRYATPDTGADDESPPEERPDWATALYHLWLAALGGPYHCDLLLRLMEGKLSPTRLAELTGTHKGTQSRRIDRMKMLLDHIRAPFASAIKSAKPHLQKLLQELGKLD